MSTKPVTISKIGSIPTISATLESPLGYDIYPLYWTTSKGGILMGYSNEFKRKAIELFYQGEWPKTPAGVSTHIFHNQIREWVKLEQVHDPDINKPKG